MVTTQHQQRMLEARERALSFPTWEQYQQDFYKRYNAFLPHYEWCDSVGCEIWLDEADHTPNCYTVHHTGTITVQALGEEYECQVSALGAPGYSQSELTPYIETPPGAPAIVQHKAGVTVLALPNRRADYDGLRLTVEHYATVKARVLVEAFTWDGGEMSLQRKKLPAINRRMEEISRERENLINQMQESSKQVRKLGMEYVALQKEFWELILGTHEAKDICLEQGRIDLLKAGVLHAFDIGTTISRSRGN